MEKAMLYIHGKGGSANEAERYKSLCPSYDVFGIEFDDFTPWGTRERIIAAYGDLSEKHDSISLIANSIGGYYSMLALQNRKIKKAFLISPILDVEKLILDMLMWMGATESELKEKQIIHTEFGEDLSWKYLTYVREHPINWKVVTEILYGGTDNLVARETVDGFVAIHNAGLTVMEAGEHWFHTKEQLDFLDAWMKRVS